jgi:hypothetical protein
MHVVKEMLLDQMNLGSQLSTLAKCCRSANFDIGRWDKWTRMWVAELVDLINTGALSVE